MKNIFHKTGLLFVLLVTFAAPAQYYVFDAGFGTGGKVNMTQVNCFTPVDVLFIQDKYYIIGKEGLNVLNYDGTPFASFGVDGYVAISTPGVTYSPKSAKADANSIYIFGFASTSNPENTNMYIAKMDLLTGAADTGFGSNGIKIIDLGTQELCTDILLNKNEQDVTESLYAVGSKYISSDAITMVLFKLLPSGDPDFAFDPSGYKTYNFYQGMLSAQIFRYQNSLLLTGITTIEIHHPEFYMFMVDDNGVAMTNFGTAGLKTIPTSYGMYQHVINSAMVGDKVYAYISGNSFTTRYSGLMRYDLTTESVAQSSINLSNYYGYFSIFHDGKVLISGKELDGGGFGYGGYLRQLNQDLTLNNNFHNGYSTFNMHLQEQPFGGDTSVRCTYIHDDGKIFAAALSSTNGCRLAAGRIMNAPLATDHFEKNYFSVSPNPAHGFIQLSNENHLKIERIAVCDLSGKQIFQIDGGAEKIDVSALQQGVYLLQVATENQLQTLKFIKQ